MENKIIKNKEYTLGEEITNSVTHGIGVLLSIAALIILLVISIQSKEPLKIISSIIYGMSLIVLYTMSTLYHSLIGKAKNIFQILDHCSIYLLIAGSYTPYTLVVLRGKFGLIIFLLIWIISTVGIVLNSVSIFKFKILSQISYLLLGWIIIFVFNPLRKALSYNGLLLLILGGLSYTLGALFYYFGRKVRYFHSIFHIFVLLGSIFHFFSVALYVL